MRVRGAESGQASVELVAVLPLLCVLAAVLWQASLAGWAWWMAGNAAVAAARAEAVSGAGRAGALSALPDALEGGARVRVSAAGDVRVAVRVPSLLGLDLGRVAASARMEPQS